MWECGSPEPLAVTVHLDIHKLGSPNPSRPPALPVQPKLLESPALLRALFGASVPALDATFDRLADLVERHLDARLLADILGRGPRT